MRSVPGTGAAIRCIGPVPRSASRHALTPSHVRYATPSHRIAVNAALSGLAPATTYYYRVVATNSNGTANGSILNFTTRSGAPSATTQAANAAA